MNSTSAITGSSVTSPITTGAPADSASASEAAGLTPKIDPTATDMRGDGSGSTKDVEPTDWFSEGKLDMLKAAGGFIQDRLGAFIEGQKNAVSKLGL